MINMNATFLNNCNAMLGLLFGELAVAFIVYLVGQLSFKPKVKRIGIKLCVGNWR